MVKKLKRIFFKVLPFAAALLLATSCSKDDNNSVNDEVIDNSQQIETVVKTFKTLTVKGKVNKSISKVTVNDNALAFDGNEVFTFGNSSDNVYGTINFTNADGSYTATVNYTDEQYLNGSFIATLGSNPDVMSTAYDNLAAAVKNAYYTIDFTITQNEGEYKLKSDNSTDIVVNLQSAFIKALSDESATLGGEDITVAEGKYYVVPVGKAMGSSGQNTIAGKIYNLGFIYVDLGVKVDGKSVYWAQNNLEGTYMWGDAKTAASNNNAELPTKADFEALANACHWVWQTKDGVSGMYAFKLQGSDQSNYQSPAQEFDVTYKADGSVPYIFLPAAFGRSSYRYGIVWSSTPGNGNIAYCLFFNGTGVSFETSFGVEDPYSVVTVRSSN